VLAEEAMPVLARLVKRRELVERTDRNTFALIGRSETEPIPRRIVCICETLDEAREAFDGWLYCLPRQLGDEPHIVETWL